MYTVLLKYQRCTHFLNQCLLLTLLCWLNLVVLYLKYMTKYVLHNSFNCIQVYKTLSCRISNWFDASVYFKNNMFDNILEWLDWHSTDLIWNELEGIAPSVLLYLKSVILFFVSFYDATFLCRNVTWDLQKKPPKGLNCFRRRQNAFPLAVTYITSTLILRSLAVLLVFPEIINWIFFN